MKAKEKIDHKLIDYLTFHILSQVRFPVKGLGKKNFTVFTKIFPNIHNAPPKGMPSGAVGLQKESSGKFMDALAEDELGIQAGLAARNGLAVDEFEEHLCRALADADRILPDGREPGHDHLPEVDAVKAGHGDILPHPIARRREIAIGGDGCEVVGIHDRRKGFWAGEQQFRRPRAAVVTEKARVQQTILIEGDAVLLERRPVSRDAVARDGDIRPRDKDDIAVAVFDEMFREPLGPLEVLALDGGLLLIGRLEGDERDVAADELAHRLGIVLAAQAKDAVQPQRTAVVEKASAPHLSLLGDEYDLEIVLLHFGAEAV